MSVVSDAVQTWKSRLSEIERQIGPLQSEADELREAIAKLESAGAARRRPPSGRRPGRPRSTSTARARAPRGQNRARILAAIKSEAKTAGDVAKETGIGRATVSTTLSKLANEGAAVKAQRGYRAA
jgi:DNA invertase Pin-like site-specific DNA recombinase